ncbi:MAG TPA: translation elongation factor Ts [Acidimicrobiales bacterium]
MAEITAKDVKALRDATGAGMMDAKRALTEANGDMERAVQLLREWGIAKSAERADREANEGAIALAANGNAAAIVQIRTETDFTAKSEGIAALAQQLAEKVLADGEGAINESMLDDQRLATKENLSLGTVVRIEAAPGNVLDTYLHTQDGRGINAVIVEGSGVDPETLHEVALHIAFAKPTALTRDEVPEELAQKERAALLEITKAEGKPEAAWDKIVEGRLAAWYKERVLLEQGMFGEKETVQQKIGKGSIVRFAQAYIGA